jgi:hypothetical protein
MKMKILDELIASIPEDIPVRSVLIGAHWTVVCSRHCGMATSLMSSHPHGHAQVRDVGHLHEKTVRELAQLAYSDEMLEPAWVLLRSIRHWRWMNPLRGR